MHSACPVAAFLALLAAIAVGHQSFWGVQELSCSALCTAHSRLCVSDLECGEHQMRVEDMLGCGCCPGCLNVTAGGATGCTDELPCEPGYMCLMQSDDTTLCVEDPEHCLSVKATVSWQPRCELDGSYSAVQCKGEWNMGRCFCYSEKGIRIYGLQWWDERADNMTCACSRRMSQLNRDASLHCSEDGGYEELQCNDGLCWCADPQTGAAVSRVVPENMFGLLPCYDADAVGSQYLRQCESVVVSQARVAAALLKHGTKIVSAATVQCDMDGSYGFYQTDQYTAFCTWKDKSRIGSWATPLAGMTNVNCYCARDTKYYEGSGRDLLVCSEGGGYQAEQFTGDHQRYCVDKDGFVNYGAPMTSCPPIV